MRLQVRKLVTELKAIWNNPAFEPVRRTQQTSSKGNLRPKKYTTKFGDDQVHFHKVLMQMIARMVLVLPVGAVGIVLCVTIIGLPLGIPIMLWVGAFCSKPIRKHPAFDITAVEAEEDWSY